MGDDIHAERREPETPEGAFDLHAAGNELLEQARELSAGRKARTLTPGPGAALKQTLVAILGGRELSEHRSPSPATLQVLHGSVTLTGGGDELAISSGEWVPIPEEPHTLRAEEDAVVLITVSGSKTGR